MKLNIISLNTLLNVLWECITKHKYKLFTKHNKKISQKGIFVKHLSKHTKNKAKLSQKNSNILNKMTHNVCTVIVKI